MNRRRFLYKSGIAAGVALTAPAGLTKQQATDPMARIGITTVTFRNRFPGTNPNFSGDLLTLEMIPEYLQDRFGIYQPEYWSQHFESREKAYLTDLKRALDKNHCTLINIQADTPGLDMSHPDPEIREKTIEDIKEWIDVGVFLGAQMVRGSFVAHSLEEGLNSMKKLAEYAADQGVILLSENHFDLLSIPENHAWMAKEVGPEHYGLIADFGNYPESTDIYAALETIAPHTKLVSAKTHGYDENYQHTGFDFDRCIKIMERGGFRGVYSVEQWENDNPEYDYERIVDWMVEHVKANLT